MNTDFLSEVVMADALLNHMRGTYPNYTKAVPDDFDQWATDNAIEYEGLYKKTKKMVYGLIYCTHCHERFMVHKGIESHTNAEGTVTHTTCPYCGQRLTVKRVHPSKELWNKGAAYCCLPATVNGIECYRIFSVYVFEDMRDKKRDKAYAWSEFKRLWHGPDGERVSTMSFQNGYYEAKTNIGDYLKKLPDASPTYTEYQRTRTDTYMTSMAHYPQRQVIDSRNAPQLPIIKACLGQLKSRAILHRVIERSFYIPMIETLVKTGQVKAAAFLANVSFERGRFSDYDYVEDWHEGDAWPRHIPVKHIGIKDVINAFRVANRHGYAIEDPEMYMEYLDEMFRLGMDLHSPKYLCPSDLADAHYHTGSRLDKRDAARIIRMEQYRAWRAEQDAQRNARWAEEQAAREARWKAEQEERLRNAAKAYAIDKAPYLGIVFKSKNLEMHVLQSVDEFEEEAGEMQHCVVRCGYYEKRDSVILSCRRRKDNSRVSTVEVKFDACGGLYIAQNRGYKNAVPPFIKESNAAIEKHFPEFLTARKQQLSAAI